MGEPSPDDLLRLGKAAFSDPSTADAETVRRPTLPAEDPTVTSPAASGAGDTATSPAGPPAGVPSREFGRYRLLVELGRGGMGVVWKAWDTQLARVVALKLIRSQEVADSKQVERFLREARAAARLKHPHIVAVHDVGVLDGQHYFTSDYVEGESLESLRNRGPLPAQRALSLVKTVCEALAYAHAQGIVHRDIKPANILLDKAGQPYVGDFGLAKDVGQDTSGPTLTGEVLGTPAFMSPEQARGRVREVGPASDQFSVGVMLYLLVAEVLPFRGEALPEVLKAILEEEPLPPSRWTPALHPDVDTICLKALEKDPGRRYDSMEALAADLGRHLAGEPILARPLSTLSRVVRRAVKNRRVVVPSLLAVAAFAAFGVHYAVSRSRYEHVAAENVAGKASLEKLMAVRRVVDRWAALGTPIRAMEACVQDDSLSPEERRERMARLWKPIQDFIDRTPSDRASLATMRAFAGWAKAAAGEREEGIAWIREAQRLDHEVPYGFFMEALALMAQFVDAHPLPATMVSAAGLAVEDAPAETSEAAGLRDSIRAVLVEARKSPLWGREGAEDLAAAMDGFAGMASGDYALAETGLSRALEAPELRNEEWELRFLRALARYHRKDLAGAREDVELVLEAFPRHATVLYHLALFWNGEAAERTARGQDAAEALAQARTAYDRALAVSPGFGPALYGRAQVRLDQGDADGAEEDLRAAAKAMPGRSEVHAELGCVRVQRGEFKAAIAEFDEALRLVPGSKAVLINRSLARRELGDLDGAIADATKAIEIDRRCGAAYNNRATARYDRGDLRGALEDFDLAIRLGVAPAGTWYGRGRVKDDLGDPAGAIQDYTKAIEIDRSLAEAWFRRGVARLSRRQSEGVERVFADLDEAVRLSPRDPAFLFIRGYVRMKEGRREGAIDDLRRVLDVAPADWKDRARAQELLGELEAGGPKR